MSKTIVIAQTPDLSNFPREFEVFKPVVSEILELASEMQAVIQTADYMSEEDCANIKAVRNRMVKLRTGAEKLKKEGKAHALEISKMWDAAWNQIKAFCEEQEGKAKELETRAEREQAEAARLEGERRLSEIEPYILDRDIFDMTYPDLSKIPSVAWPTLLAQTKAAFEAEKIKAEQEAKAEAERIKAENEAKEREAAKARITIERVNACRPYMRWIMVPDADQLSAMSSDEFMTFLSKAKEAESKGLEAEKEHELAEAKKMEAKMAEMAKAEAERRAKAEAEAKAKAETEAKEAEANMADNDRLKVIAERIKSFMSQPENSLSSFQGSPQSIEKAKKANGKMIEAYMLLIS